MVYKGNGNEEYDVSQRLLIMRWLTNSFRHSEMETSNRDGSSKGDFRQ